MMHERRYSEVIHMHSGTLRTDPNHEHETLGALTYAYEDIVHERDRLRDARASVTSQLGPLPASAGIAISLVGTLADGVNDGWLIVAAGLFVLLVVVSTLYSGLWPYRRLRAKYENELADHRDPGPNGGQEPQELGWREDVSAREWLEHAIELERRIYGPLRIGQRPVRPPFGIASLQDGFDAERTGLYVVQLVFVGVIVALIIGVLVGS